MKTVSSDLWQLVNTLTSAEKTYFKRNFISVSGKVNPGYLKLFDEIAAQKVYDENKIIAKCRGIINAKNISAQKSYLYDRISSALIYYHSTRNSEHDIYQQILLIRLYRSKGLLHMAHKAWRKAITKARNENAYSMLTILKSEFEKMVLFNADHIGFEESYKIFRGNIESYENFIRILQLRDLYAEILLLKSKAHFDLLPQQKNKLQLIHVRLNELNVAPEHNSFWPQHYFLVCKSTIQYLNDNSKDALDTLHEVFNLWKKNPKLVTANAEFFIEIMNMINYAGIACANFSLVQKLFEDPVLENIKDATNTANFKTIQWLTLSKIYHKTANYKMVEVLVGTMHKEYNSWVPLLNAEQNKTLHTSLSISCFALEMHEQAYHYCKLSLDEFRKNVREESSAFAHLFLLLISYEMNNMKLFEAAQVNTNAYFYKKKKQHPFEKIISSCLAKSFYLTNISEKNNHYESALLQLEQMKENAVQQAAFKIFNYPRWLQSKIERMNYRQYVEKITAECN